jgi:hypothetical protein
MVGDNSLRQFLPSNFIHDRRRKYYRFVRRVVRDNNRLIFARTFMAFRFRRFLFFYDSSPHLRTIPTSTKSRSFFFSRFRRIEACQSSNFSVVKSHFHDKRRECFELAHLSFSSPHAHDKNHVNSSALSENFVASNRFTIEHATTRSFPDIETSAP